MNSNLIIIVQALRVHISNIQPGDVIAGSTQSYWVDAIRCVSPGLIWEMKTHPTEGTARDHSRYVTVPADAYIEVLLTNRERLQLSVKPLSKIY